MAMLLRAPILAASRSRVVRAAVSGAPVTRSVVRRFVAGESVADAVAVSRRLVDDGLSVSLDHLGEDTTSAAAATTAVGAYTSVLRELAAAGLAGATEVSVKLTALGLDLDADLAEENARQICRAAQDGGTTVTVDMEDSSRTDATLRMVRVLRTDFPWVGAVVQSYLRRSEEDCRELTGEGSRVRLCKGAYREPQTLAFTSPAAVEASYARCLGVLLAGSGYPMVATHDPRLIALTRRLADERGRSRDSFELQMLYGVRPDAQRALAAAGERVRVYVPYGDEWYPYLMRRLAERPANVTFFLRSLASRS
jgi:proline dehydrogenase